MSYYPLKSLLSYKQLWLFSHRRHTLLVHLNDFKRTHCSTAKHISHAKHQTDLTNTTVRDNAPGIPGEGEAEGGGENGKRGVVNGENRTG